MTQQFPDWIPFVSLIITLLCSFFSISMALLGVIIGGGVAYLNQSRLQKQQREWDLDDKNRLWKRERIEKHLERSKEFLSRLHQVAIVFSESQLEDILKEISIEYGRFISDISIVADTEIVDILNEFKEVSSKTEDKEFRLLKKYLVKVIDRLSSMLEDTYR